MALWLNSCFRLPLAESLYLQLGFRRWNETSSASATRKEVKVLAQLFKLASVVICDVLDAAEAGHHGVTRSIDRVGQWPVVGSCLGGRGLYEDMEAAVPNDELGVLMSDGKPLSIVAEARLALDRLVDVAWLAKLSG